MADSIANVKVLVTEQGLEKLRKGSAEVASNFAIAAKEASSINSSTSRAAKSAPSYATKAAEVSDYGRVRGTVGTGAAGRDFAKQSQGLGGVVALYATFAANIFAVGAAFEALNKAAAIERLTKATEMMSVSVGANLKGISKDLVEASGHALSFAEAMQFSNIGTSAGLAGTQIANLTKIARGAASALGRDANDSVRRIIQGTAKQEQEILDELGIFVKSKQAFEKYAKEIGVKADDLTGRQRTQAYANEVERLGEKWKKFAEIKDPFSEFLATGKNAINELLGAFTKFVSPVLQFLAESKEGIQALIALVTVNLAKRVIPELGGLFNNLFNYDKDKAAAANAAMLRDINVGITGAKTAIAKGEAEIAAIRERATMASDATRKAFASNASVKGGVAGVSVVSLNSKISAMTQGYTDISKLKSAADLEHQITQNLKTQAGFKKDADAHIARLVSSGTLVAGSTKDNLILTSKLKETAAAHYAEIQKTATEYSKIAAIQKTNLANADYLVQKEAEASRLHSANDKSRAQFITPQIATLGGADVAATTALTAAKEKATIAETKLTEATAIGNVTDKVDIANTQAQTVATTQLTVAKTKYAAAKIAEVVALNKGGMKDQMADSLAKISTSFNQGGWTGFKNGILDTGVAMSKMLDTTQAVGKAVPGVSSAAGVAGAATSVWASATVAASGATKILALGLKGLLGALSAAFGPIMIVVTVWQLFGDTIKEWLGITNDASKALDAQKEKLKEYNDTLGILGLTYAALIEKQKEGFNSLRERADFDDKFATAVNSQIDAYKKLASERLAIEQQLTIKLLEEKAKQSGKVFDAEVYAANNLGEILDNSGNSKLASSIYSGAADLEEAVMSRKWAEDMGESKDKIAELDKDISKLRKNLYTLVVDVKNKVSEANSTASNKAVADMKAFEKVVDAQIEKQKKLGDKSLGLNTDDAVTVYKTLNGIITNSIDPVNQLKEAQAQLAKMVAMGGAFAYPYYPQTAGIIHSCCFPDA